MILFFWGWALLFTFTSACDVSGSIPLFLRDSPPCRIAISSFRNLCHNSFNLRFDYNEFIEFDYNEFIERLKSTVTGRGKRPSWLLHPSVRAPQHACVCNIHLQHWIVLVDYSEGNIFINSTMDDFCQFCGITVFIVCFVMPLWVTMQCVLWCCG